MANLTTARLGVFPPVTLLLLSIALIASAAVVFWFTLSATRAFKLPRPEVVETYARCNTTSCLVVVTVQNLSGERLTVQSAELHLKVGSYSGSCFPALIEIGGSASCSFSTGLVDDGDSATLTLTMSVGGIQHSVSAAFRIVKP
ncbi:MAG: hypothetical protein NZ954_00400 [Thermofilaceae archaeon]|nr:hypothetical protein [Thermofilaceae archaeon]MCX8180360.1 hypothetical protein [Thermofilaceae archaeon]MDW8003895.1 hypothetical protein [Thermofilaceae archaeon]